MDVRLGTIYHDLQCIFIHSFILVWKTNLQTVVQVIGRAPLRASYPSFSLFIILSLLADAFPICRHGKSKILRDQRRMTDWVLSLDTERTRRNSSTVTMHSMEAHNQCLSDQVGQRQSKLDRAAFHRDLIQAHSRHGTPEKEHFKGPSSELLPEWASLIQTAARDTRHQTLSNLWYTRVHRKRTVRKGLLVGAVGQALQGESRLQLTQRFKHS